MTLEDERKADEGGEERGRDERDQERAPMDDRQDDDRDYSESRDDRRNDAPPADEPANGRRRGKVARWNGERGFGFITPSSGNGPDVFCHITAITDGNALPDGGDVEYEVSYDDRQGKERATNVTGGIEQNRSDGSQPLDPGGLKGSGKFSGSVARWNQERGFGFITPASGGEDLFCHTTSIVDGNALPEGGKVTYDQEYDDKRGKEHAINVAGGCEERRRDDRDDRRGGYDDRRGGYDDRRGGYDDRRGGYDDRRGGYDDRRGGYDDRRGGHDDRRGGYDDRRGGAGGYDDRRGHDDRRGGYEDDRRGGYDDRRY